jgi:hypothetical protein
MPQPIFNVVPKDPQIQHVTANMHKPSMHKHACEDIENIPQTHPVSEIRRDHFCQERSSRM